MSHQTRLTKTKSFLDTQAPPTYSHLIYRAKQEQLQEERYTQIEHENRLLLKKMTRIMHSASLDNLHITKKATPSLNAGVRKKALKKIMDENQAILKRIQSRKPFYTKKAFDDHAVTHSSYRNNISERKKRFLPALPDSRATTAPERSINKSASAQELHTKKPARKSPKPKPTTSLKPAPVKRRTTKKPTKKKKPSSLSKKGGYYIGGAYVIVTTEEIKTPESHALRFVSYEMDSALELMCEVPFASIEACCEPKLLKGDPGALVDHLVSRLSFTGTVPDFSGLVFNSDKDFVAPEQEQEEAAPAAAPVSGGGNLAIKLSSKALDGPIDASVQLFTGGKLISKTEGLSGFAGGDAADGSFESIDLQTNDKAKSLELKLFDKEKELATGEFSLGSLEEGKPFTVAMSDTTYVITLEISSESAEVSIDLDKAEAKAPE